MSFQSFATPNPLGTRWNRLGSRVEAPPLRSLLVGLAARRAATPVMHLCLNF
jgi:hypothetical protein